MEEITLTGKNLTIKDIMKVSYKKLKVKLSEKAMKTVFSSREIVEELAYSDTPIYGFNRGVGLNKDQKIDPKFYETYNRDLILSHSIGIQPEAKEEVVRAAMVVRLNTLLLGYTGIQPEIIKMYKDFLNYEIHPIIPERGSVGVADIGNLSFIGLAMIGEGEVHYKGVRIPAKEALQKAGLHPIVLGPKDGLAIVSSNALTAGKAALLIKEIESVIDLSDNIFAMSLEAFQGNVSPLNKAVNQAKGFPGQLKSAELIRNHLRESSLWSVQNNRALQDPLSFRSAHSIHGSVRDALEYVKKFIILQINTSDDNPCLLFEEGLFISSANYEVTSWVVGFEMLGIALSHLSKTACYRIKKLTSPSFAGLTRFLHPRDNSIIAFSTIQKTFAALDSEIRHLSNPVSADYFSLAGGIEDHASNSMYVIQKTEKIIDNLYYILAIEVLHAAQAIDIIENKKLGIGTKDLYDFIRSEIAFLDQDQILSDYIQKAYHLLKSKIFHSNIDMNTFSTN